ncbi:MAG: hypothetical protein JWM88_2448 [Verrucomicrobia bacterium]|nr:hypothetical protein [Verrucomicrobiota bacterium]
MISVTHELAIARPAETIVVPWSGILRALPGAAPQQVAVKDDGGRVLPCQVDAGAGLIFQHDFAPGEQAATFTVEKTAGLAPAFPAKVFARHVPERFDDFAWENDKVGHRTYGPALATPAAGKDFLVTSGLDVWCKRVPDLIVDRWYRRGHYHTDSGEGLDMYHVGPSRGCGGTGIWDGRTLAVSRNYSSWRITAEGPIRVVFELTYDAWDAGGFKVAETKRFTVDAGHNLDEIESTFDVVEGSAKELTVGLGLNKDLADKDQEAAVHLAPMPADGSLAQWSVQKTDGQLGLAIIVPRDAFAGYAEDALNQLILARARPGQPLRYYVGAGWSKAGEFATEKSWTDYVAACAARIRAPVKVEIRRVP